MLLGLLTGLSFNVHESSFSFAASGVDFCAVGCRMPKRVSKSGQASPSPSSPFLPPPSSSESHAVLLFFGLLSQSRFRFSLSESSHAAPAFVAMKSAGNHGWPRSKATCLSSLTRQILGYRRSSEDIEQCCARNVGVGTAIMALSRSNFLESEFRRLIRSRAREWESWDQSLCGLQLRPRSC